MCGLFGFSGDPAIMNNTVARLALNKIKILGLYNIDRGKHSCGIFINNEVIKGIDNEKMFSDFIAKKYLPLATESGNFTIIGHTRSSTGSSHTVENAHPFIVNDDFVMAHNGIIQNVWSLCEENGIDHENIHVDSLGLAYLLDKVGLPILEKYRGFASLLMTRKSEPNTLSFYRGCSKRYQMAQKPEEERPLYYLQTEEGIYFSSIEKSLLAISDNEDDMLQIVPGSTVFRIENGKVLDDPYIVERGISNFGIYQNTTTTDPKQKGIVRHMDNTQTQTTTGHTQCGKDGMGGTNTSNPKSFDKVVPVIWHETLPARASRWKFNTGLIYHLGRYWIVDNDNIIPAHGSYYVNNKGRISSNDNHSPNRFFIEGIMMKNKKAYEMAKVDPAIANPDWNFMMYISKYSEYPVCASRSDVNKRCKNVPLHSKYRWYENESLVGNKSFTPMFSDRHYTIKDGLLDKITAVKNLEKEQLINSASLAAERKSVEEIAKETEVAFMHIVKKPIIVDVSDSIAEAMAEVREAMGKRDDDIINTIKVTKEDDLDLTNFYMKFDSIDQALATFSLDEQRAIRYYVSDIINEEGMARVINVYEDAVDLQFKMFLQMCIDNESNVIDCWNQETHSDILTYLLIAKNNKDGFLYDEYEEVNDKSFMSFQEEDVCCNVPKPLKETGLQNGWTVSADPKDDKEPSFLEETLARARAFEEEQNKFKQAMGIHTEEATVPEEDEFDRYKPVVGISDTFDDDTKEKDISFEEIVDGLLKVREEADAMQAIDDNFCQDVAYTLYRSVDPIIEELMETTRKHKELNLEHHLQRNIKLRVKS